MTVIVQDDHVTAGAWAACALTRQKRGEESIFKDIAAKKKKTLEKKFRSETDEASIKKLEKLHVIIKE